MHGLKHEPMRSRRLRVWRMREVARFLGIKQSDVWMLTHDTDQSFPQAHYIPPSTFVWDQDAVESWDYARRSLRRRAFTTLRELFA
jgi:predicted DNA-binding transcriptional regulator AlpA